MKTFISQSVMHFIRDKVLLGLSIGIFVCILLYVVYVSFSLSPTELQIATRYTAFGDTQYHRTPWYHLLGFIGMGVLVAVSHIALMMKLHIRNMRSLSIGFGALTLIIIAILFAITTSVLGIAYL